jgi:hypothetical protein
LGISGLALLTALYFPPAARFLHTAPLTMRQWIPVLAVGVTVSILSKPVVSMMRYQGAAVENVPAISAVRAAA